MLTEQKYFELERQQLADHSRLESEAKAAAELRWQVSDLGNDAVNNRCAIIEGIFGIFLTAWHLHTWSTIATWSVITFSNYIQRSHSHVRYEGRGSVIDRLQPTSLELFACCAASG